MDTGKQKLNDRELMVLSVLRLLHSYSKVCTLWFYVIFANLFELVGVSNTAEVFEDAEE